MSVTRKDDSPAGRRQAVVDAIDSTMAQIEKELEKHAGIYPHNDGVLNQAEVCRRASVRPAVLQGPAHKETTLLKLNQWLGEIKQKFKTKKKEVRKEVSARYNDLKSQYEDTLLNYTIDRQDLNTAQAEMADKDQCIAEKDKRIAELEDEVAWLREQLSEGKIVPIRKPGDGKDSLWQDRP